MPCVSVYITWVSLKATTLFPLTPSLSRSPFFSFCYVDRNKSFFHLQNVFRTQFCFHKNPLLSNKSYEHFVFIYAVPLMLKVSKKLFRVESFYFCTYTQSRQTQRNRRRTLPQMCIRDRLWSKFLFYTIKCYLQY